MNKFINILLLLLMFPAMGVVIYVGFDLPVEFLKTSGKYIPYKQEIFLGFGILFLIVGGRRSFRRWAGMRLVAQISRYQWNEPMGKKRLSQAGMYLNLEAAIHFVVAGAAFAITPESWPVAGALAILGVDHLVFGIYGRTNGKFRVGITKNAIVVADRDVKIIYYTGLRRVTTHQQSLFFDYIKELQIAIPIDSIAPENRTSFRQCVEKNIDRDKVYFSEGFKAF